MSWAVLDLQPKIKASLEAMLSSGHMPHALLFAGAAAERRRLAAAEIAKALFCERQNGRACDACRPCRLVGEGRHPDHFTLSYSEDSQAIKIENVRELIFRANMKPYEAPYKVFVIDPADAMTEDAQNALLKTLEEPAGRTLIVLIPDDAKRLLPTIRSRAQSFYFAPETSGAVEDPDIDRFIARCLLRLAGSPDATAFAPPEYLKGERDWLGQALDGLIGIIRAMLLTKEGVAGLLNGEVLSADRRRLAEYLSADELIEALELAASMKEQIVSEHLSVRLAVSNGWEILGSLRPKAAHAR